MQNRFASLFIAALLPLLLFRWFVPTPVGQIDFWLMWLVSMVFVGLPLLYAEIGLAQRSLKPPALGIQELTRQADASTVWRSFVWVSVLLVLVIAALSIDSISSSVMTTTKNMGIELNVPAFALSIGMVVVAGILSLLGMTTLLVAVLLVGVAFMIAAATNASAIAFIMTDVSLTEWAKAVTLTLASVGIGTGIYWFNNPTSHLDHKNYATDSNQPTKRQAIASKTVLPIWLTQLLIGSVALFFATNNLSAAATFVYAAAILFAAAFLLHYASSQFATRLGRFGVWIATLISIVITALLVLATPKILSVVLVVLSLVSALILAIFSGWQMKISHMRKSLNFSSEAIYNLWRIATRIVAPLLIIVAAIGWLMP